MKNSKKRVYKMKKIFSLFLVPTPSFIDKMPFCLFCQHRLALKQPYFYCNFCQAYFCKTLNGLKYKHIEKNETGRMKICEECTNKKQKKLIVRNFDSFFKKVDLCSDCKNRNINFLKDQYFTTLDKKCLKISVERSNFIIHFLITLLCFLWDKSIILVFYSILRSENLIDLVESLLTILIWFVFGHKGFFYCIIYILQFKRMISQKLTRFEIDPEEGGLTESFKNLKL